MIISFCYLFANKCGPSCNRRKIKFEFFCTFFAFPERTFGSSGIWRIRSLLGGFPWVFWDGSKHPSTRICCDSVFVSLIIRMNSCGFLQSRCVESFLKKVFKIQPKKPLPLWGVFLNWIAWREGKDTKIFRLSIRGVGVGWDKRRVKLRLKSTFKSPGALTSSRTWEDCNVPFPMGS